MSGEIAKLCDAIMRGEDWTGGEPSLWTCRCIADIKREAARLEAIENKSLTQPQPEPNDEPIGHWDWEWMDGAMQKIWINDEEDEDGDE